MSYRIADVTRLMRLLATSEDRGFTIPELAKRSGLHSSVVRRWVYAMHAQRCIYVKTWRYVIKQWTRVWAWGINEIDAPKPPRLPEQTYRQRSIAKKRLKANDRADWAQGLSAGAVLGIY